MGHSLGKGERGEGGGRGGREVDQKEPLVKCKHEKERYKKKRQGDRVEKEDTRGGMT